MLRPGLMPGCLPAPGPGLIDACHGRLAQLVERHVYTVDVGSSSLSPPTNPELQEAKAARSVRLTLDCGLHRAASSALQRLLNENRRVLRRRRVLAVTQRTTENDDLCVFKLLKGSCAHAARLGATVNEIERHLAAIAADCDTIIFSDENMPGLMVGRQDRAFAGVGALAGLLERLGASVLPQPNRPVWLE